MDDSDHVMTYTRERRAWRERILNGMLWAATITCLLTLAWSVVDSNFVASSRISFAVVSGMGIALLIFRRLPYVVRVTLFLLCFYAAIIATLAYVGLAPNVFIAMAILVVMSTLLFGRLPAMAVTGVLIVTLIVLHRLHVSGVLTRPADWMVQLDIHRPTVVTRVCTILFATSLTLILAISYLLRRNEDAVRDTFATLMRLQEERAAKQKVEADLENREAAYRRASELELLGRLSGSVAHDFNNALLIIFSALDEIGERSPLWNAHPDALNAIRSAARQAASTTRQLRSLGPVQSIIEAPLPLAPALHRTAVLLQRILPASIRLTVVIDEEVAIAADENVLQRILTNLALNARDALKDGGQLTLRVCRPHTEDGIAYAQVEVTDNGAGMSEEVQANIFSPFFTTKPGSGTGLGLASVKELVTSAGGHVHVKSALGQGTTIGVCWPLLTTWVREVESEPPAQDKDGQLTVLFVDDDPIVRRALSRGMADHPMTLLLAGDGNEAGDIIRDHPHPIHVLCSDCMMPGQTVNDLVAAFRARHPEGKVMICSGYEPDDVGVPLGLVDDFFPKPFSASELVARIRHLATKAR